MKIQEGDLKYVHSSAMKIPTMGKEIQLTTFFDITKHIEKAPGHDEDMTRRYLNSWVESYCESLKQALNRLVDRRVDELLWIEAEKNEES